MNRLLAGVALGGFIVALAAIAITSVTSGGGGSTTTTTVARTTTLTESTTLAETTPKPPMALELTGAGTYDPEGDRHENDDLAPLAVDGDPATFWKTEHYLHQFTKTGVGLLLDARMQTTFSRVVVGTDSAGSSAQIQVGDSPSGPFRPVSPDRPLNGATSFALNPGASGRYLVVWITAVPEALGEAHVTEVKAFS